MDVANQIGQLCPIYSHCSCELFDWTVNRQSLGWLPSIHYSSRNVLHHLGSHLYSSCGCECLQSGEEYMDQKSAHVVRRLQHSQHTVDSDFQYWVSSSSLRLLCYSHRSYSIYSLHMVCTRIETNLILWQLDLHHPQCLCILFGMGNCCS